MPDPASARIFVSYSRKDGAAFAANLRRKPLKKDLSVWQNRVALEGGRDAWSQIGEAIRSKALQHFVLIVTPAALANPVVRREIRLARQEGKTVFRRSKALVSVGLEPCRAGSANSMTSTCRSISRH